MCIVKKSPRSSLRLFSLPLISVRGVSLKPSFERKQHLMSPPIFFAPFFYQTFFPPLLTKIFFLPHNTSSTRFFNHSQPPYFFSFSLLSFKKTPRPLPSFNAFKKKFSVPLYICEKTSSQILFTFIFHKNNPFIILPFPQREAPARYTGWGVFHGERSSAG